MRVAVTDTGIGIPEDEIPLVTQRFYQVDLKEEESALQEESVGEDEGSGLGLAIASEIAEAHGSSLDIESVPGDGTTIEVCFPRAKSLQA